MILSHRYKFVFIKGRKVAGTSVEIALSQLCGPDDIVTPITPIDERLRVGTAGEPRNYSGDRARERRFVDAVAAGAGEAERLRRAQVRFYNHMPLRKVIAAAGPLPGYQLLFVERSPYAKVLSLANWRRGAADYRRGVALPPATALAEEVQYHIDCGTILEARNIDLYRDEDGGIAAAGWRYETIASDFAAFCDRLGLARVPLPHAKRGLNANALGPATMLTTQQIAFIDHAFAEEFDVFGYDRLS